MKRVVSLLLVLIIISCTKKEAVKRPEFSIAITDSLKVITHLDSLRTDSLTKIDLSEFKNRPLRKLNFKLIPIEMEGTSVDEETSDSLFNLVDENFFANWMLLSKQPKFFVIETEEGFLATLSYKLEKLDAIRYGYIDPSSNNHQQFYRQGKLDKKLNIVLHHERNIQVDENWNFETDTLDSNWSIDGNGMIQKK